MTRFIKKIIKAPLTILNILVKRTNWYRNTIIDSSNYPTNEWYREHLERNFDIVNVGSSSALYAFDYSGSNVKAFNWALQPQSMEYSFKVLKNFHSILKKNGYVIIPFSPFSALSVDGKWDPALNERYFGILDYTLIENYKEIEYRKFNPVISNPKTAIKRLIKDVPAKPKGREALKACTNKEDFKQDANFWIDMWKKEFAIDNLNAPVSEENKNGMKNRRTTIMEMIDFCLERSLQPILVIPPMHPALANKFTSEFCTSYIYSFINDLNIHEIPFYNYMNSKEFTDDKLYTNSFFMSQYGAKIFTNIFLNELGLIK